MRLVQSERRFLTWMRILIACVSSLSVSACVITKELRPRGPIRNEAAIDATPERVWQALIDYASVTFDGLEQLDERTRTMRVDFSEASHEKISSIDCENAGMNDTAFVSSVLVKLETEVKNAADGRTLTRVTARYEVRVSDMLWAFNTHRGASDVWGWMQVRCQATGAVETALIEGVKARLDEQAR